MAWQLIEQFTGDPFPAPYYRNLCALLFLALAAVRLISSHRFRDLQAHSRIFHLFSGRNRWRFLSIYMEAAVVFFHPIELFGAAVDDNGSLTGYYWFLVVAFLVNVLVELWLSFPVDGSAWRPMFHFFFIFWALIDVFFRDIESLPKEYYSYVGGYLFFVVGCSLLQFLAVHSEQFGGEPSGSTGPLPISTTDACYMLSFSFICWALVFLFSHSSPTDYYLLGAFLFFLLGVHLLFREVRFDDDRAAFDLVRPHFIGRQEAGLTMGDKWIFCFAAGRRALDSFLLFIHRPDGAAGIARPNVEGRWMTGFLLICCALIVVVFQPITDLRTGMDRFESSTEYRYLYLLAFLLLLVGVLLLFREVHRAVDGHVLHVMNDQRGVPARERRRMKVLYGLILICRGLEVILFDPNGHPLGSNGGGQAASTNYSCLGGFLVFVVGVWIMLLNVN